MAIFALTNLRREMELRWTGQFVENAICSLDEAAATIAALQAELAEAREVLGRIVEWLRVENSLCDCFAWAEVECGCGTWDDYKTKPLLDIATAIEARDWSKQ